MKKKKSTYQYKRKDHKKRLIKSNEYYLTHKEERREYHRSIRGRYAYYKSNSKIRGREFTITFEQFESIVNQECFYCGESGYGIDRIDNSKGYIIDNILSCCSMCNFMKHKLNFNEFIEQCNKIANNQNI